MHVFISKVSMNAINISSQDFHIRQHFGSNWTTAHMQKFADVPEVPIAQLYRYITGQSKPILLLQINRDTEEEPSFTWKLLTHPGTYIGTISMIFIACIGFYCLKRFWYRPATPRQWPYLPVSLQHTIVDDDVEVASIYRSKGTVKKPVIPNRNHELHTEWEAARLESHCKQPVLSKVVLSARSLATKTKTQGMHLEWLTDCKT